MPQAGACIPHIVSPYTQEERERSLPGPTPMTPNQTVKEGTIRRKHIALAPHRRRKADVCCPTRIQCRSPTTPEVPIPRAVDKPDCMETFVRRSGRSYERPRQASDISAPVLP